MKIHLCTSPASKHIMIMIIIIVMIILVVIIRILKDKCFETKRLRSPGSSLEMV